MYIPIGLLNFVLLAAVTVRTDALIYITRASLRNFVKLNDSRSSSSVDLYGAEDRIHVPSDRRLALEKASQAMLFSFLNKVPICVAVENPYDRYASNYDELDGGPIAEALGIDEARSTLLKAAHGKVLEVGAGTGLNLEKYIFSSANQLEGVSSLTLIDFSSGMLHEAQEKINASSYYPKNRIHLVLADATSDLVRVFGMGQFDTVVDTFSLCVMGNDGARKCLAQLRDILKPGGLMLLLENTRSTNKLIGFYQDLTAEKAASLGGKGCLYNQNVSTMIQETGGMQIVSSNTLAGGLFTWFKCVKV